MAAITAARRGQAFLLWGVTGAGKTEVYLQAAAEELTVGRSVLLLAPEIGLIPQLLDRCRARFGSCVIEYHSGMTEIGCRRPPGVPPSGRPPGSAATP